MELENSRVWYRMKLTDVHTRTATDAAPVRKYSNKLIKLGRGNFEIYRLLRHDVHIQHDADYLQHNFKKPFTKHSNNFVWAEQATDAIE